MSGNDCLWNGRHAYHRGAHGAVGTNLGRSLETGPANGQIGPLLQRLTLQFRRLNCYLAQSFRVGFGHIEEAEAAVRPIEGESGFVWADQRIATHHVDVVADEDQLPDLV